MNNLSDILKYGMDMERCAKEFYSFYKNKISNESIRMMFESLADMEDEHYNILKTQLDRLEANDPVEALDLSESEGARIILDKAEELKNIGADFDTAELPILRMAYSMENDFATFYQKAADEVDEPNAKALLETLARWEITHRDDFAKSIEIALQQSWFGQGFAPF